MLNLKSLAGLVLIGAGVAVGFAAFAFPNLAWRLVMGVRPVFSPAEVFYLFLGQLTISMVLIVCGLLVLRNR
jgi:hypothetical protein